MSLGYGGTLKKMLEDDTAIIYSYSSYNLNDEKFRNAEMVFDGTITVDKSCFVEPEIHEKLKKMPSGRKKLVVKRIPQGVDISEMMKSGKLVIENSKNMWDCINGIDRIALHLCYILFKEYQIKGSYPDICSYHV